jgi:hypothetical protein
MEIGGKEQGEVGRRLDMQVRSDIRIHVISFPTDSELDQSAGPFRNLFMAKCTSILWDIAQSKVINIRAKGDNSSIF